MTRLRSWVAFVSTSPVKPRALTFLTMLTACLSASCESYRDERVRDWTARERLLENPAEQLPGYYRNLPIDPERYARVLFWKSLTGRPSEASDLVRVEIDSGARMFNAVLVRGEKDVDDIALSYRDGARHLHLEDQNRLRFEKFPLVYGVGTLELWVGKNRDGLSLYSVGSGGGFIVVFYAAGGSGPGGAVTFKEVEPQSAEAR